MKIKYKILLAMMLITLVSSVFFTTLHYHEQKNALITGLDNRLLTAAHMARATLPDDFHDSISDSESVSHEDYLQIVSRYNRLCKDLDMEYLWSLLEVDGRIVFTTGTATSKTVDQGDFAAFFETHSNPTAYAEVFRTMAPQYQEIDDKWGDLRVVLVPFSDTHGRKYLFGASVSMAAARHAIQQVFLECLTILAVLIIATLLFSLTLARSLSRPIERISNAAQKIAAGGFGETIDAQGSEELLLLSDSVNHMSRAIQEQISELREREERLSITLDSIGDAVIATDSQGAITRMNRVAERLTGWLQEDALGKPLQVAFRIHNARTGEVCEDPVQKVLSTGEIVGLANHTVLVARDGVERQIADSGAPIRSADNKVIGVVLVFRDVTEEYALQEQLRHSQKMDAVGRLAGGVAHDFNNMLAGVLGGADLLEMEVDSESGRESLRMITESAERAADLTAKLLAFGRKSVIETSPVDVHRAVESVADILSRTLDRKIKIHKELTAEASTILGDMTELQNAFLNLGINASHAMPDGGELFFQSSIIDLDADYCESSTFDLVPGRHLEINVRDTGVGIPIEDLQKIFEPFYTTKPSASGTGLGLAAVYGTVLQHNGAVAVYSETGKGTVFRIYLPLSEGHVQELPPKESPVPGTGRILVVDDEPVIRITASAILGRLGYDVIVAENGHEGLEVFRRERESIDLVLLDMIMPEMGGNECFAAMRNIQPDARVILSSGFTRDANVKGLMAQGLCGFIRKPYRTVELSRLIGEVLATVQE